MAPVPAASSVPSATTAAPAHPAAALPTPTRTLGSRSASAAPRPVVRAARTASPRPTVLHTLAPPPPGIPPYAAPTVAATRFLGCPLTAGGGWTFTAEVDLVGGSEWRPSTANLQHTTGSTWRYSLPHPGNGASAPPPPAERVTWGDVGLWGSDGSLHDVRFPARMVIQASCPS